MRHLALVVVLVGCGSSSNRAKDPTVPDSAAAEASADDRSSPTADTGASDVVRDARPDTAPDISPGADRSTATVDPVGTAGRAELIRGGFGFTEGPLWIAARGFLLFSDLNSSTIHRFTPPTMVDVFRTATNRSNGLALDPQGRLVICETATSRVTRSTLDGAPTVVADRYRAQPFTRPNDVIVRSDGTIYFTDINVAVYRIDPAGVVHLVSDTVKPNGIALSPDEKTLYVSNAPRSIWSFPVTADGSTGAGARLADISAGCDGMAVDDAGNLYTTVDTGIQVLKPTGESWGTIPVPERPANCSFGGADRKTLLITARTGLYQVRTAIPGLP